MAYTVKKLAELSGVSVRTLHFYDQIGLLSPAYLSEATYAFGELLFPKSLWFLLTLVMEFCEMIRNQNVLYKDAIRELAMKMDVEV